MKISELFESYSPAKKQKYLNDTIGNKILTVAKNNHEDHGKTSMEIIEELTKADPSNGYDFLNFIAKMYVLKQFKLEDIKRLNDDLKEFIRIKSKLKNKDINSYKTLNEFYDVLEEFKSKDVTTKNADARKIKDEGTEKLIYTNDFKAFIVKTKEAACFYGAGTKWCTAAADDNKFDHYNDKGPLIVIILKKDGKDVKFQLHYESDQFMNERDQEISQKEVDILSSFPEYSQMIDKLIAKHYISD